MPEPRVAIIYDDTARPETTGVYCRRGLESFARVEHFLPAEARQIPREGFDLYLVIDDGMRFNLPGELRPAAWWAIDTHLDFEWYRGQGTRFDHVFVAQRPDVERLLNHGLRTSWLPLACDPAVHRKHEVEKRLNVCFVGNLGPGERQNLVWLLQERFRSNYVGRRYFDEMAETYSASRIVFNRSIRDDLNMRVFEALACGSLLLTNALPPESGQEEIFREGTHLATYRCAEEMLDKARFYLEHEAARERIAAAGREQVLAGHTYLHRMRTVLETMREGSTRSICASKSAERSEGTEMGAGGISTHAPGAPAPPEGRMRVLYLGRFSDPWSIEQAVAEAVRRRGHVVDALDEGTIESPGALVRRLAEGGYDCLLFTKGRIGRKDLRATLFTTGEDIAEAIRGTTIPCYTWYFDRALGFEPSREQWMRRVAPLCRVAFVVDGPLTKTDWANWHWLQQGIRPSDLVSEPPPFGGRRHAIGFIGSVYGKRVDELAAVSPTFALHVISDAFGPARHDAIHECEIILGTRFPAVPGYWPDRLYLVLGHGAFFLAPEVEGMREEGFEPGVHFAPLGADTVADIRYWLSRPRERQRIARAGQELVLRRFTYDHRVEELCRTMAATLKNGSAHKPHRFQMPVSADNGGTFGALSVAGTTVPQATGSVAPTGSTSVEAIGTPQDSVYFEWPVSPLRTASFISFFPRHNPAQPGTPADAWVLTPWAGVAGGIVKISTTLLSPL